MKISCQKASRLMSLAQDRPLSTGELVKLRVHLALCGHCRNFNQHLKMIRLAARRVADST